MNIEFRSKKHEALCASTTELKRAFGKRKAGVIEKRLLDLAAAETLDDLSKLPHLACHPLTNNLKGQFSVKSLDQFRITFCPNHDPLPLLPDGGLDRKRVTAILIVEIDCDYH